MLEFSAAGGGSALGSLAGLLLRLLVSREKAPFTHQT